MFAPNMMKTLLASALYAIIPVLIAAQHYEQNPYQDRHHEPNYHQVDPHLNGYYSQQELHPHLHQPQQPFAPVQTALVEGEQWRQLHAKVFASHQKSNSPRDRLAPEQTREILRQLQEIYYGKYWKHLRGANIQTSEIWWTQLSKIASLLRVSHVSSEKCYGQNFAEFNRLIAISEQNNLNLLPYLYHYRGLQLEHCKNYANENLHSAIVASLSSHDIVKMDQLATLVKQRANKHSRRHQVSGRSDTSRILAKSVAELLSRQSLRNPSSPVEFEHLFRHEIVDFCHRVTRTVEPVEYIAELEGSYPMLNQAGYDWISNADICRDILHHSSDISAFVYDSRLGSHQGQHQSHLHQQPQHMHQHNLDSQLYDLEVVPEPAHLNSDYNHVQHPNQYAAPLSNHHNQANPQYPYPNPSPLQHAHTPPNHQNYNPLRQSY